MRTITLELVSKMRKDDRDFTFNLQSKEKDRTILIELIKAVIYARSPGLLWGTRPDAFRFEKETFNYGNLVGYSIFIFNDSPDFDENKCTLRLYKYRPVFHSVDIPNMTVEKCFEKLKELQDINLYRQNDDGKIQEYEFDDKNSYLAIQKFVFE